MTITYDTGTQRGAPNSKSLLSAFLHGGNIGEFEGRSAAGACLTPLLEKLGWRGEARHLAEALPHFVDELDLDDVRIILSNLNYVSTARSIQLCELKPSQLPCLFTTDGENVGVIYARNGDTLSIFDGKTKSEGTIEAGKTKGTAYLIQQGETVDRTSPRQAQQSWIWNVIARFKRLILETFAISFVTNLTAMMVPIFIMGVYDRVIALALQKRLVTSLPASCSSSGLKLVCALSAVAPLLTSAPELMHKLVVRRSSNCSTCLSL